MARATSRKRSRRKSRGSKKIEVKKERIEIFIKKMTGDLLLLEVSSHESVLSVKRQISELCEDINPENIKLFDSTNGDELMNDKTIHHYHIENEHILFMFVEDKPPFQNKKWIRITGKNLDDKFDKHDYSVRQEKFKGKITNPAYVREGVYSGFQGKIEDFLENTRITRSTEAKNFREFTERIPGEMKYVYTHRTDVVRYFMATNSDSSIIYENKPEQVMIYIRGYFIQLSLWKALYDYELGKLLTDDDFLVRVLKRPLFYINRKEREDKAEKERKKQEEKDIKKAKKKAESDAKKSKRTERRKTSPKPKTPKPKRVSRNRGNRNRRN